MESAQPVNMFEMRFCIHCKGETPPDLSNVVPDYHVLQQVFSKSRAMSLPPHWPYDCAIDLFPVAPFYSSRLYNLYINEYFSTGIIHQCTFPLGAGFFFVAKKDVTFGPALISEV